MVSFTAMTKLLSVRTLLVWPTLLLIGIATSGCISQTVAGVTQSDTKSIKPVVAFAGITFQGGPHEQQKLFRYTAGLVEKHQLSIELFGKLYGKELQNFTVSPVKLSKRDGSTYALSLMLDGEYVSVEHLAIDAEQGYKLSVFVSAQAVLFDVQRSQFVAAVPLQPISSTSFYAKPPSNKEIEQTVLSTLIEENQSVGNILDNFVKRVSDAPAPNRAKLVQLAVTNVDIEDKADWALPAHFKSNQYEVLKSFIAQQLIKNLSINQNVATQPFVIDSSVLEMRGRFSGEDTTYTLALPKPAYAIDFTLRGLKKIEYDKNKTGQVFIYASFANLLVKQQVGEQRTVLDLQLKNGASKPVPVSMKKVDDWAAFNESIMALLANISRDLHVPKSSFYEAQNFDKGSVQQILALKGAYQRCQI